MKTIIISLLILALGSCTYALIGVFKNAAEVQTINKDFVTTVLSDTLPPVKEGYYSEKSSITNEAIAPVNRMISALGTPESIEEFTCSGTSSASTYEASGQFVTCTGSITYRISPATLTTRWRKENVDWKLMDFALNISNIEAYANFLDEKKISEQENTDSQNEPASE